MDLQRTTVEHDLAAALGIRAEDRAHRLRASRADQAGEAQHLALIGIEADVLDHSAGLQVPNLQYLLATLYRVARELIGDLTTDHVGDDLLHGKVAEFAFGDVLAVAHNGHIVHNVMQLLQAVGNIDDGTALGAQLPHDAEHLDDLRIGECRRRLIHHEHTRIDQQRLGDFHHLLSADGQLTDDRVRIQIGDAELCKLFARLPVHLRLIQSAAFDDLAAEEHICSNGQVLAHIQFLVNDRHTQLLRPFCVQVSFDLLTEDLNFAGISGIYAGEYFHQGRFTGAVFSQQRHDLASS